MTRLRISLPNVTLALIVTLVHVSGNAQTARIELHQFQTTTLTDQQFLTGMKVDKPLVIAGELRIPTLGTDRLPAVIIVHGSGGILGNEDRWSQELNAIGVATFVLDGFTARGIANTVVDQSQLGTLTMINDAYRALELLARHPRIDRERIGIMGGSRGGRIALYAALKRFQRMWGPTNIEFAIYLPFYAPCYTAFANDTDVSDRPIRLFHGAADDYVPAAPCRSYVERLRRAGKDAQLTEYPGAYHMFDNPLYPLRRVADAQTARRCTLEEKPIGQIINSDSGRPFTWDDPCVERGVTVGYDARAYGKAIDDLESVLKKVFSLH